MTSTEEHDSKFVIHFLSHFSLPPPPSLSLFPAYEDQVVAFFRQPNIEETITQRYRRTLRPQMREAFEDIRRNGVSALERVQLSGGGTALELTMILRWGERERGREREGERERERGRE